MQTHVGNVKCTSSQNPPHHHHRLHLYYNASTISALRSSSMHASHTVLGHLVWNHKTRPANADARMIETSAQIKVVEEGRGVMQVMHACVCVHPLRARPSARLMIAWHYGVDSVFALPYRIANGKACLNACHGTIDGSTERHQAIQDMQVSACSVRLFFFLLRVAAKRTMARQMVSCCSISPSCFYFIPHTPAEVWFYRSILAMS